MSSLFTSSQGSSSPSLLAGVAAGRRDAMESCVSQYKGLIWSIVRKYCSNQHEAEDLTQEIFVSLWRSAGKFDPQRSAEKTFIGLIARRRCIDWVRKQNSQPSLEHLEPELLEKHSDSQHETKSPHSSQGRIDVEELKHKINSFPEETRQLFDFHFRLGMTHQQLADKMQMPLGTVKSKLRSGILQLRSRYQQTA